MNTIQLECFIAVAQHLNFSRASESLKITQPAVSHQIQTLEEELGVKLFRRTSKSVSLTSEGIQFLPDAELILRTAHSARERLGRHEHFIPFEIGCHNHLEQKLLPPVFHSLAKEFPLLRPSVRLVPFPSLLGLVENQQIHAAFGIKEEQNKSSLFFRELYSAPVKKSVNGKITYNTPCPYQGMVFHHVSLEFKDGKIVKATCDEDNDKLNEIFDTDEGARYVGEFSLGFNPMILNPMGDILYDEKILGSLHFTPGRAYKDCYNGNDSAIHWDMVLIQTEAYGGGEVWFDDVLIRKNGRFVLEELQPLNFENR